MDAAARALERLRQGNRRFVEGTSRLASGTSPALRDAIVEAQSPFAVILGCSDSRVPVEIVFDQGLGDLFVIRVAGNVVAPSGVGSVEFAAERFGTRLVVVLGHSRCGAVQATLEVLLDPAADPSRNLRSIVDRVRPSVEPLLAAGLGRDLEALAREAVRANVRCSVEALRRGSPLLEAMVRDGRLAVVGAEYRLETGEVTFLEPVLERVRHA